MAADPPLTSLEIASCAVVGRHLAIPDPAPTPARPDDHDPVAALDRAVLPGLRRPPCLVSFSGGHDSSLVLAAATRAARRERLPLPVPVTWRAIDAPLADESQWQEAVVSSLRLPDWIRLPAGDDLDFVGPVAAGVLRRHGLLYPANAYLHAPLCAQASGGTLLTGFGGDQVLGLLPRPRRPSWAPAPHGFVPSCDWLQPGAGRDLRRHLRSALRERPGAYAGRPGWAATRRDLALSTASLELLGRDTKTVVTHPLLDKGFLAALCGGQGPTPESAGGRAGLIGEVFGAAYPPAVLERRPKARFGEVFWRRHTRSLTEHWSGDGVDADVVDRDRLRSEWDRPDPALATAMLVQQCWLAREAAWVTSASA